MGIMKDRKGLNEQKGETLSRQESKVDGTIMEARALCPETLGDQQAVHLTDKNLLRGIIINKAGRKFSL